jgi:aminoglycoside phosphotransferase (APT) family kinase protein
VVRGLRDGGSPWLLRAGNREVVLRAGRPADAASFATEAAALRLAADAGIPAPRLLGHDDGTAAGVPLVLTDRLAGSSRIPSKPLPGQLPAIGAAAAHLHAVPLAPSAALPLRERPIATEDFTAMRHDPGRDGLLRDATALLARTRPADHRMVFVHGDLWHGNTLWAGGVLQGLIDWDCAGAGAPGVDLGSLRLDAALCHGMAAAAGVLRGWEETAGRAAADIAYWDAVAALATPPDLGWFPAAIAAQGRPDLDRRLLLERRGTFLRQALDHLS